MLRNLIKSFGLISVSSLMLGATSFIKPDVAVAEFTSQCNSIEIISYRYNIIPTPPPYLVELRARCRTGGSTSRLNISPRIGNNNGILTYGDRDFQLTCRSDYKRVYDSARNVTALAAACPRLDGTLNPDTVIDLDALIGVNINGSLYWVRGN